LLIQATTADHLADRLRRVRDQPALPALLAAGVQVEGWGWVKRRSLVRSSRRPPTRKLGSRNHNRSAGSSSSSAIVGERKGGERQATCVTERRGGCPPRCCNIKAGKRSRRTVRRPRQTGSPRREDESCQNGYLLCSIMKGASLQKIPS
jgi:hypothetical protein